MRLSYKWLKQLVNFKESPEKLAEILNMHVANVEKVEKLDEGLDKVIVAEIMEIKPHPNADKLQIAFVKTSIQDPGSSIQIVCGAPNIKVGQKVPLALPGAKLPIGIEIKESVIRGVKSEGMLCAEDELGIGPDHTGIYILPPEAKIGQSIAEVLGLDDTVFEIENKSITHRPDLFSHMGFGREIAVVTKSKIKSQKSKLQIKSQKLLDLKIKVEDEKLCPRYMAVVMDGVKLGPSPLWMQNRLRNVGIRPINNIVDITNYVLVEYGQPLHAFDYNKISEQQIIIRPAKKGEKILALDGKEYELNEKDLIIADNKRPIAIAGVMGGELFSINPQTTTIVIESASFDPVVIRRTAWRLGLQSESSLRFEKGLPMNFPELGIQRAIELVQELAGGKVVSQIYDLKSKLAREKLKRVKKIKIDFNRINKIIGLKIAKPKVLSILKSLGFNIKGSTVKVPVFRPDIEGEQDLVEEIIRIYGCEKIPPQPIIGELKPVEYTKEFILEREIKNILVGCGFDEVYNYSFGVSSNLNKSVLLEVANPLNPDQHYLRVSLIPGLIKNTEKNANYFDEFKIFEIGKVFYCLNDKIEQPKYLAGLIYSKNERDLYFLVKGILELLLNKLNITTFEFRPLKIESDSGSPIPDIYQSQTATELVVNNQLIGYFGLLKSELIDLKTKRQIGIFEIDLEKILSFVGPAPIYQFISPYPTIKRDLAFLVDKKITWQEIFKIIKDIDPLIKKIELFDVFEDKRFGEKRNLAFHLIYQSDERTLKTEEVDKIQEKIIQILKEKFGAELRNF